MTSAWILIVQLTEPKLVRDVRGAVRFVRLRWSDGWPWLATLGFTAPRAFTIVGIRVGSTGEEQLP
jgi:hypothetical protein